MLRGHEGGPLVIGNVMYIRTPFPNIGLCARLSINDNKIIWKYEPKQDPNVIPVMCCDTVNRGVAYGDGKIFLYQADTTLVALKAKTGAVVWSVKNGDPAKGETGTSAPLVVKDKVLVGISGGEFGVGLADRLRHQDRQAGLARLFGWDRTTKPDRSGQDDRPRQTGRQDSSLKTWKGDQWKIGGGCTWGWYLLRSRSSTWFITARAIPRPGIPNSVPATTDGR